MPFIQPTMGLPTHPHAPATLRFAGMMDYARQKIRPYGLGGMQVDSVEISKKNLTTTGYINNTRSYLFPDNTSAYFKRDNGGGNIQRERGAYILSRILELSIIPETVIAEIPSDDRIFDDSETMIGSLQEGVSGNLLEVYGRRFKPLKLNEGDISQTDLIELFLYTIIAYDDDQHDRNLMLDTTGKLFSIDNEYSGPKAQVDGHFPDVEVLKPFFEKLPETLPDKYIQQLMHFVINRDDYFRQLQPYYTDDVIECMFTRAEFIIDNPVIKRPKVFFDDHRDLFPVFA